MHRHRHQQVEANKGAAERKINGASNPIRSGRHISYAGKAARQCLYIRAARAPDNKVAGLLLPRDRHLPAWDLRPAARRCGGKWVA